VIIINGSAAQSQRRKIGALLFGASFVVQSALVADVIEIGIEALSEQAVEIGIEALSEEAAVSSSFCFFCACK